MGRRLTVVLVIVVLFVGAGVAFALLSGDDDQSDPALGTTRTTTNATITSPSTTSAPTTAPSTTAPPSTTAAPDTEPDPCGIESAAITAAVGNGVSGARDRAQVERCRLAAADPSYAAVRLVAKAGADFTDTTVVLQGGGGTWAIVATGTNAACSQVPLQVLVDLGIGCASGGGV